MNLVVLFNSIQSFLLHHAIISPIVYALLHVLFAICCIPCSPMAVIAGALWGKWLGLGVSISSAILSSCATFGLSRLLMKEKIYNYLIKRYAKTDWFLAQTKKHGWKFVATVQLNPAAPGSTLGYLFGLTDIKFSIYALFSILFMLPLQLILVLCGSSFSSLLSKSVPWFFLGIALCIGAYLLYGLKNEKKLQ